LPLEISYGRRGVREGKLDDAPFHPAFGVEKLESE
jgi:hypothetical protein